MPFAGCSGLPRQPVCDPDSQVVLHAEQPSIPGRQPVHDTGRDVHRHPQTAH